MKLTTSDAHTGADRVPEPCQLDFRQPSSSVIENSLMRHADSPSQQLVRKTQPPESANAVGGHVKAGAARRPRCGTFDDFRNEALLSQRSGECETRDSTADNQNTWHVRALFTSSLF